MRGGTIQKYTFWLQTCSNSRENDISTAQYFLSERESNNKSIGMLQSMYKIAGKPEKKLERNFKSKF